MKTAFSSIVCIFVLTACSQGTSSSIDTQEVPSGEHEKPMAAQIVKANGDKIMQIEPSSDQNSNIGLFTGQLEVSMDSGFTVSLLITNSQPFGVPVQYRSGMTADLQLIDSSGTKVWAWSDDMMFTQAIRDEVMPAGQVKRVTFNLPKSVLTKVNKRGYHLIATFAGHLTESKGIAMADVSLSLDPYRN